MSLILFLSKMIVISGMLFSYYWFFLRNKKFHQYNRFYLLSIPIIAVCLPLMNIPIPGFYSANPGAGIKLLKVVTTGNWEEAVVITAGHNYLYHLLSWQNIAWLIFLSVACILLFIFARNMFYIKKIAAVYPHTEIDGINFFQTEEPGTPFSFLKNIFWNIQIDTGTEKGRQIFMHEVYHVKQKHTADIIFMEVATIAFWFNPFFHLAKKEIKTVHEFLADQYAALETNRHDYAELLLLSAAANNYFQIANPFFNNQIKRRIIMLTQLKKPRYSYISRLMALPLLFVLICAFALKINKPKNSKSTPYLKPIAVVIDAGHGGIFNGTINSDGIQEKNINLSIAKKIQSLGKDYHVNVVLTRDKDATVGNASSLKEDLQNRVKIASENNADVFISLHVDGDTKPISEKTGFSVSIPNDADNKYYFKSKMLGSAIVGELKDIYATEENLEQKDKNVIVLDKNNMPSILVECGYINNKKDLTFITDKKNQEKIARNILEGIIKYNMSMNQFKDSGEDTVSAEELNKINTSDVSSMNVSKEKNIIVVKLKSGDSVIAKASEYSEYMKKHKAETQDGNDKIFTKVEVEAEYPGGQAAWIDYLTKNLKYPQEAVSKNIHGTVVVQFIVGLNGSLSEITAAKKASPSLDKAAIDVIRESGKWVPAMQNGKKVRSYKKQPIAFKLQY